MATCKPLQSMRRQINQSLLSDSICLRCAARLYGPAPLEISQCPIQRRTFRIFTRSQRPGEAAARAEQADDILDGGAATSTDKGSSWGSWGGSTNDDGLTLAERRAKEALRPPPPRESVPRVEQVNVGRQQGPPRSARQGSYGSYGQNSGEQPFRQTTSKTRNVAPRTPIVPGSEWDDEPNIDQSWKADTRENVDLMKDWKHLKRQEEQSHTRETNGFDETLRQLRRQQQERFLQAKSGSYVSFRQDGKDDQSSSLRLSSRWENKSMEGAGSQSIAGRAGADEDPIKSQSREQGAQSTFESTKSAPGMVTYRPLGSSGSSMRADQSNIPTSEAQRRWDRASQQEAPPPEEILPGRRYHRGRELAKDAEGQEDYTQEGVSEPSPFTSRFDGKRTSRFVVEPDEPITGNPFYLNKTVNRQRERLQKHKAVARGLDGYGEDEDIEDAALTRIERRQQRKAERKLKKAAAPPTPIMLPEFISIGNLAGVLHVRVEDFVGKLQQLGFEEFTNDHVIGAEEAGLIALEFNYEPIRASNENSVEDLVALPPPAPEDKDLLLSRPPVITIMGHVDHGKTTLLDWLRKSSVAAGEHGGITQHIGAFVVQMPSGREITFLDTPGHAAFLDMRARGANVTDIVILVVAADDSVKPQTIEAIKHAKGANVPIIVAINKVDKEDSNPDKVKRDLAQHGIEVEDYGGDVQAIPVSGKTGLGMEDLEDAAVALADVLDVRADSAGPVEGWVLEATQKRAGKVATVLVRRGTITPGNIIVAGQTWARVRSLKNQAGQAVQEAGPGVPVEVDGWREQPEAGAEVLQAPNEQRAREVVKLREERAGSTRLAADVQAVNEARRAEEIRKQREEDEAAAKEAGEEALAREPTAPGLKLVPLVLRADVSGSAEALSAAVLALGNSEVRAEVLRSSVGGISESDIELANVAQGCIINFNQNIDTQMRRMAEMQGVRIIDGNVIYRVVDEAKVMLEEHLPPNRIQKVLGEAEIAQIFDIKVKGRVTMPIAGCRIKNGAVEKNKSVRVMRGKEIIYDGTLSSLKSHKKDVQEIRKGAECGLGFTDFGDFKVGDTLQSYRTIEEKRTL